jgi:ubiquinone/menaquinone biosynthesis C-methylase UbiE
LSGLSPIFHLYNHRALLHECITCSALKTWAEISPQARVLDVACGTGEFERLLLAENPSQSIIGVDISDINAGDRRVHFRLLLGWWLRQPRKAFEALLS